MKEHWHIKVANKFAFDNYIGTFDESNRLWKLVEELYKSNKTFYVMRFKDNKCVDMMKYNNRKRVF